MEFRFNEVKDVEIYYNKVIIGLNKYNKPRIIMLATSASLSFIISIILIVMSIIYKTFIVYGIGFIFILLAIICVAIAGHMHDEKNYIERCKNLLLSLVKLDIKNISISSLIEYGIDIQGCTIDDNDKIIQNINSKRRQQENSLIKFGKSYKVEFVNDTIVSSNSII